MRWHEPSVSFSELKHQRLNELRNRKGADAALLPRVSPRLRVTLMEAIDARDYSCHLLVG